MHWRSIAGQPMMDGGAITNFTARQITLHSALRAEKWREKMADQATRGAWAPQSTSLFTWPFISIASALPAFTLTLWRIIMTAGVITYGNLCVYHRCTDFTTTYAAPTLVATENQVSSTSAFDLLCAMCYWCTIIGMVNNEVPALGCDPRQLLTQNWKPIIHFR